MSRSTSTKSASVEIKVDTEIVAEYAKADRKGKLAIRSKLNGAIQSAIREMNLEAAASAQATLDALAPTAPERDEVDFAKIATLRVHTLRLAADMIEAGAIVPAGFPEGYVHQPVTIPAEELADNDAMLAEAKVIAGTRLVRRSATGERGSIPDSIARAFEGKPSGTVLKVSEIVRFGSTDSYKPSPGAVAAYMGRPDGVDGFEVIAKDDHGPLRLRKA